MKKLLLFLPVFALVACDNVDISKYPEDVQTCYNNAIYDKSNCTKNRKTIVKYCECLSAKNAALKAEGPDEHSVSYGIRAFVERNKIRNECAEITGYTFCNEHTNENN